MNKIPAKKARRTPNSDRGFQPACHGLARALKAFLLSSAFCLLPSAFAVIPEPDNVLYGTISLNGAPVTATRTDVVIEARRTASGPAIASYRMGSTPALGSFYSLRISMESLTPVTDADASQLADNLVIVVTDGTGVRAQATYTVAERGTVQRVDFGAAASDSDGDGLPDAWELLHFTNLSRSGNSPAAGGQTALQAFTAGSDPNDPNGAFRLNISENNGQRVVSFVARRAEGVGYEGMTRYYALESNLDPGGTLWPALAAYEQITGNNQTVTYQAPGRTQVQFYRGKVWLASSGGGAGDTDTDGLPDVWETQFFGNLTRGAGTPVANGQTALQSYTSGTNPNDPNSVFKVSLSLIGNQQAVAFLARMAEGTGYEGRTRLYTLQSADRLDGIWQSVPGQSGIVGANQTVTYQTILSAGPQFYRAQVSLSP